MNKHYDLKKIIFTKQYNNLFLNKIDNPPPCMKIFQNSLHLDTTDSGKILLKIVQILSTHIQARSIEPCALEQGIPTDKCTVAHNEA